MTGISGEPGSGTPPGAEGFRVTPQQPDSLQGLGVPESSTQRLTAQDVERASAEARVANIQLMDDMEESVSTQGQWFVRVGDRKPITETQQEIKSGGFLGTRKTTVDKEVTTGYDDNRALILRAVSETNQYGIGGQDFTVVTPDGILTARFYTSEVGEDRTRNGRDSAHHAAQYDQLQKAVSGDTEATRGLEYKTIVLENGGVHRSLESDSIGHGYNGISLKEPTDLSPEDFQNRVQESIALTESPHKANVEAAQAKTELATAAVSMIRALPPRP